MGRKIKNKPKSTSGSKAKKLAIKEAVVPQNIKNLLAGAEMLHMFTYGEIVILLSKEMGKLHISMSHHRRDPTWEEIRHIRYELAPESATMALILPPKSEYVNLHVHCFHLWEVRG